MSTAPSLQPGLLIDQHWRLERRLSAGATSSVWEAENVRLGGRLAIKFLRHEHLDDERARARFVREARAMCKVRSPHIVQVHDQGVTDGLPYLVMELLDGEDLGSLLARERRLSLDTTSSVVDQLARGLTRAHRAGYIHRDLKPANVFVIHEDDGRYFVKLLDFGTTKQLDMTTAALTQTDAIVGTPHYLSPEQIERSHDVDQRADVWALGVLAYRMLLGKQPFDAASSPPLLEAILAGRFDKVGSERPELPVELEAWFARALALDRAQRFQTVKAASAALSRIARQAAAAGTTGSRSAGPATDMLYIPRSGPLRWLQSRSVRWAAALLLMAASSVLLARWLSVNPVVAAGTLQRAAPSDPATQPVQPERTLGGSPRLQLPHLSEVSASAPPAASSLGTSPQPAARTKPRPAAALRSTPAPIHAPRLAPPKYRGF